VWIGKGLSNKRSAENATRPLWGNSPAREGGYRSFCRLMHSLRSQNVSVGASNIGGKPPGDDVAVRGKKKFGI